MADVFVSITDPRQAGKVEHDLVELLVIAVNPEHWPDLKSFAVIESERCIDGKTSIEQRFYISKSAGQRRAIAPGHPGPLVG